MMMISIDYKEFKKGTPKIIGVYDDHDYGVNNGDKTFKKKKEVREIYLDFIGEPEDSERRMDKDSGIYQDYIISTRDGVKVHFILLDVRYDFTSTLPRDRLGAKQLAWLDNALATTDADVTLLASGV
jgi:alkaline phosphatase D